MTTSVEVIALRSDGYSPMSAPHDLAALRWAGLAKEALSNQGGPGAVEDLLRASKWEPEWRSGMYSQAHYHSTTHELLIVIAGSATIQLGGTDERAKPRNQADTSTCRSFDLLPGDTLLVPAGYSHRSLQSHDGFTMIGSYPRGSAHWDMRFPNIMGCPHDCERIEKMVRDGKRKGLLDAMSPDRIFSTSGQHKYDQYDDTEDQWQL